MKSSHSSETNTTGQDGKKDQIPGLNPTTWDRFILMMNRFGLDMLGIFLICLAGITLVGTLGLSAGSVLQKWVALINTGFGWGSYLVILLLVLLGLLCFQHHLAKPTRFRFKNILALEGWLFAFVTLLALLGGVSLDKARAGAYGGTIGWGLATLLNSFLPAIVSIIILVGLNLWFIVVGFTLKDWLVEKIEKGLQVDKVQAEAQQQREKDLEDSDDFTSSASLDYGSREKSKGALNLELPFDKGEEEEIAKSRRDERLPPLNFLINDHSSKPDEEIIRKVAAKIEYCLLEFGIPAKVIGYRIGPTVTQFAVEPGYVEKTNADGEVIQQKIKVSQIQNLSKDLALALSAERLRIEAPVASQSYVGIEVPNQYNTTVRLRSILETEAFQKLNSPLALALGRDVSGQPVVADLIKMPHLLIAGTTNSGKSVCITSIALCLVMNNSPEDLKLIMFDPKMVELVRYNELPHLLGKVETNQDRMQAALQWTIQEMDNRYKLLEASKARDLESYNRKMQRRGQVTLPRIVVMIDELADLMMSRPEQTEFSLVRLAQLARATGIHLVVATQRPSAEIVTGLIKANFPARISFNVATSVDSRVILDVAGAETLLGKGDMLFINPEVGSPLRTQGVIVTDQEIAKAISFWKKITTIQAEEKAPWETMAAVVEAEDGEIGDDLIDQAIDIVRKSGKASASLLQRKMRIGFPRAARLIDELEEMGVIGSMQTGGKDREVIQGDRGYEDIQSSDEEN
jgi:S-DNA-T family DNA segregation ATPase FtsK/SpoIIIE